MTSRLRRPTTQRNLCQPESLESRQMMAANVLLDFNGISAAEVRSLSSAVATNRDLVNGGGEKSFVGEFAALQTQYGGYSRFSFLDFDGNGRLTSADGELAAKQITNKVRQDFAPYQVAFHRFDTTNSAITWLRTLPTNDAYVVVTGDHVDSGGQAHLDLNNTRDNAMMAGGSVGVARWVADRGLVGMGARDEFVNTMANAISHEVGHSFGLDHVADASAITLMTARFGGKDLNFPDVSHATSSGGTQNAHLYLTSTIGAATTPWAAVLKPGTLTVYGSNNAESIGVFRRSDISWDVSTGTNTYWVNPSSTPSRNSLNPFNTTINTINIWALGGNDFITAGVQASVTVNAYGGNGDDVIFGHAGRDNLYGENGNDILIGMDGDDSLYGGNDRDILIGGNGSDRLYGHGGEDVLLSGSTTRTNNLSDLYLLRDRWTSTSSYATRVRGVRSALNGTMTNDSARDYLYGSTDLDFFLYGIDDWTDQLASETADRI